MKPKPQPSTPTLTQVKMEEKFKIKMDNDYNANGIKYFKMGGTFKVPENLKNEKTKKQINIQRFFKTKEKVIQ